MTDKDLKILKELIAEGITPVQEKLSQVQQTLDKHQEKLDQVQQTLDKHTGSLINIESTIKIYSDMYKLNGDNIKKLDSRISTLEDSAGIEPDPNLLILRHSSD